jgi:hypothetical protein
MTSVRKKTSSEIFRAPRWLRGTPKSLQSTINPEEVSICRRMRKAIIQELRPKTPIEWILVNEFVTAQLSAMRYGTWQAAVMQFSVGEGLRRAVKNQLRSGNKGSKADLDGRAQELAGSRRPYVNDHAICTCLDEARWTASIKDNSVLNVAGIHRCASWNRGEAVSKRRPRKSRELSLTSGTARNLRLLKWRPSQEKMARVTLLN